MFPIRMMHSVVLRLVACLVLGGLLLSLGLGFLEYRRASAALQMELTQKALALTGKLQGTASGLLAGPAPADFSQAMEIFTREPWVRGVRLSEDGKILAELGHWPAQRGAVMTAVALPQGGLAYGSQLDMNHLTDISTVATGGGRVGLLEVLVDGPRAARDLRRELLGSLVMEWMLLGVLALLGLLLMRWWFTGPLGRILAQVQRGDGAECFYEQAQRSRGEFAQLAQAIGGMLTRIDATAQRLRQRERALENLYQFAPAAMVNVDTTGRIQDANHRAGQLLGAAHERELGGRMLLDFVPPPDRARCRQTLARLELDNLAHCELRLQVDGRELEVLLECTGLRDEEGVLRRVQVSLIDVTRMKNLQSALAEKGRLLNLVIDHMSDAIVLVDSDGRVAAFNQRLAALLRCRADQVLGRPYVAENFWDELGVLEPEVFLQRLRQIEADGARPAQEHVATRVGQFRFEGIPVHDAQGASAGRLWVVQDISHQEHLQRLAAQQNTQLQTLRTLGGRLAQPVEVEGLMPQVLDIMYAALGVEMVGLAVRQVAAGKRTVQLLHGGAGPMLLAPTQAVLHGAERELLPHVLAQSDAMYWADPPQGEAWGRALRQAGLTSVAAVGLRGRGEGQGMLWIARRGGERIDRQHIYLLQAVAPLIAAHVEIAQQHEAQRLWQSTDAVTDLPTLPQFHSMLHRLVLQPGDAWSALLVKVDHFGKLTPRLEPGQGDELLRCVAQDLRHLVRKSCHIARLPGPMFALACPGTSAEQARVVAQRLHEIVGARQVVLTDGTLWPVTISIGLATYPQQAASVDELAALASDRLNQARKLGGNCIIGQPEPGVRQAG